MPDTPNMAAELIKHQVDILDFLFSKSIVFLKRCLLYKNVVFFKQCIRAGKKTRKTMFFFLSVELLILHNSNYVEAVHLLLNWLTRPRSLVVAAGSNKLKASAKLDSGILVLP